jgi:hypothetical protein
MKFRCEVCGKTGLLNQPTKYPWYRIKHYGNDSKSIYHKQSNEYLNKVFKGNIPVLFGTGSKRKLPKYVKAQENKEAICMIQKTLQESFVSEVPIEQQDSSHKKPVIIWRLKDSKDNSIIAEFTTDKELKLEYVSV